MVPVQPTLRLNEMRVCASRETTQQTVEDPHHRKDEVSYIFPASRHLGRLLNACSEHLQHRMSALEMENRRMHVRRHAAPAWTYEQQTWQGNSWEEPDEAETIPENQTKSRRRV